ncbi:MAG: TonB-dependent receptor [Bacteroidales bacterium]|nr:TonB-dependent receptor [Bacteroidales bacterium]
MKKILINLLFVLLMPFSISAQITLSGKIINQSNGSTLEGAQLRLKKSNQTTVSDVNGEFRFENMKPGHYEMIVSHLGFTKAIESIELTQDNYVTISMKEKVFLSDEIVVNATRASDKIPMTYTLIDQKKIKQQNHGTDLPFLLQSTPSLVVSSDAGSGIGYTNLRIRGTDLTSINVTLNGVPVNDPESHAVYFVDLPDLASSIDNIQIQRGVGTSSNGSAAFGASINLKTESPSTDAFAQINSTVGAFGSFKNTLSFGTGLSDKGFSLNGRLSKINSDGYIDRAKSDLKSYLLSASWSGKSTNIKFVATSGIEKTYQAWYGVPKDSLASNPTYNPAGAMTDSLGNFTGYYPNQTDNYQQDYYQLLVAQQFRSNLYLTSSIFLTQGKGYYEEWENNKPFSEYGFPDILIGDQTISSTDLVQQKWLDNDYYGINLALQHQSTKFNTTIGLGWNNYSGDHFGYISWAKFASVSMNDTKWYESTGNKKDFNTFVKTIFQITNTLNLFADMQLRTIDYSITGIHDDLHDLTQNHQFTFFNPKAGLHYSLDENNSFYASVALSNREPTRTIYRDASPTQKIFSEQLINVELGFKHNAKRVSIASNLFYMDYTNQFVLTGKINDVGAAIMTNVPKSFRFGIESSVGWKVMKKMDIAANLTLSSNKINNFTEYVDNWNYWDDPENEPYQFENYLGTTTISFSPSATANVNINYQILKGFGLVFNSNYVSRQYIDNTESIERSLDPYLTGSFQVNLTVNQHFFKTFEISAILNNVFNTAYESNAWVYSYIYNNERSKLDGYFPQAGIHGMIGLTVRF